MRRSSDISDQKVSDELEDSVSPEKISNNTFGNDEQMLVQFSLPQKAPAVPAAIH